MIREMLTYSDYSFIVRPTSQIDPTARLYIEVGINCPRCKGQCPPIEHGKTIECGGCGLKMTRYGNGLECVAKGD